MTLTAHVAHKQRGRVIEVIPAGVWSAAEKHSTLLARRALKSVKSPAGHFQAPSMRLSAPDGDLRGTQQRELRGQHPHASHAGHIG